MPAIDKHVPGSFCWIELATTDSASAKKFYGELFGWSPEDTPIGGGSFYTLLKLDGLDAAAMYEQMPQQREQGIPPHWMLYVSTDDVDATVAHAKELGFSVFAGPFDVMDKGRMAVIADPQGATLGLWQPKAHVGSRIIDAPGTFCWGELATGDVTAAADSYSKLFGWTTKPSPEYTEFANQSRPAGGMMALNPEWGPVPPHWVAYVLVANCDASANKAKSLGGSVMVGPMDIPNVGRFAMLSDPQGAIFSIFQPK